MRLRQIPFVRQVAGAGPDDQIFDALLLAGPLVVLLLALPVTDVAVLESLKRAVAALYIAAFVVYVLYKGTQ